MTSTDLNDGAFDYLPAREHDMKAFGRVIPDESTDTQLGGITSTPDGTIIAEGPQGVLTYQLLMFRTAMRLEIRTGMIANRNVKCATIIPRLFDLGITKVEPKYTAKRKAQAYADLDAYIAANGGRARSLD